MSEVGGGERIVLAKWSPLLALVALAITATLAAGPVWALVTDDHRLFEAATLAVVAAVFAIPFLWTLWRLPAVLRGMGVVVDAAGIHPFDGGRRATIHWPEVAGVGFGSYARQHRGLRTKTMPALEIYLTDTGGGRHGRLAGDWQEVLAPAVGYSAGCYRYQVSPYGADAQRVEAAVRRFAPTKWAGPFVHER
jgi:hypothetical protein